MHYMALPFARRVAELNSYPTIPNSWLCKMSRTHEAGKDELGKFCLSSLLLTYTFVWDLRSLAKSVAQTSVV